MNTGTHTQGGAWRSGIEVVPDASAELYLEVAEFAKSTPQWLSEFAVLFTQASIVLLLSILFLSYWRARKQTARAMAFALLAPLGVIVAYAASELAKTSLQIDRPCRTLVVESITKCPPAGDWSFPSNHSTIAGSVAIGVLIAWPRMGLPVMVLGALAAFSRVFVGMHYPLDVVVGFLLGVLVAAGVMVALVRPTAVLVERLREHRIMGLLLSARTTSTPADTTSELRR